MIKGVIDVLVQDAGVGGAVGDKIYPQKAPQTTNLPFMTVIQVSTTADDDKGGVSDLDIGRVQVSSFAATFQAAWDNYVLARTALERYSGTNKSIKIDSIRFLDWSSLYEEDAEVFHIAADYNVREDKS